MSGRGGELRALTGVRGIAAWGVVAYHTRFAPAGLPESVVGVLAKGYLAVDFFFLLSGFVIWMSWGERLRSGGLAQVPEFLRRRVARIWPLHLAMLGFGIALAGLFAVTGRSDPQMFPLPELPLHLLLVQNWGFTDALAWNDPAWSISAELGAYLLFPLVAFTLDWRRVPGWGCVTAIGALLGTLHAIFASAGPATLGTDITRFGLVRCVLEFAAGGAVCGLWLQTRAAPRGPALVSGCTALAIGGATLAGALPETLGVPLAFAAGLLALALTSEARGNPLSSRPLHWLGEISYATYLSHYLLWFAFKLALVEDPRDVPPPLMLLYGAIVLLASAGLYHGLEKPAQRMINGWRRPARLSRLAR